MGLATGCCPAQWAPGNPEAGAGINTRALALLWARAQELAITAVPERDDKWKGGHVDVDGAAFTLFQGWELRTIRVTTGFHCAFFGLFKVGPAPIPPNPLPPPPPISHPTHPTPHTRCSGTNRSPEPLPCSPLIPKLKPTHPHPHPQGRVS